MEYFRNVFNNNLQYLEDDIDSLFEEFIEEVNSMPFNSNPENDPSFRLNQSVINNMYLLRRTMDLYPDEDTSPIATRTRQRRRNNAIYSRYPYTSSYTYEYNIDIPHNTPVNTPSNIIPDDTLPISSRTPVFEERIHDTRRDLNNLRFRSMDIDYDNLSSSNFTRRITDNLLTSLFTNFNEFIEEQLQNYGDLEDVKVILSEEEFENLNRVTDKSLIENKQCNICLEDLKDDEMIKDNKLNLIQLKCHHIYHKDCIKEWLTKQSTKCPSCRYCCRDSSKPE